jgi:L-2-hydroxyglutarate oxidase LhgO
MDRVDAVVVGAGVVGLAVARALAQDGLEVVIVEREGAIGSGVSSRNSEVIHAGLYYPPGSLKARMCVRGRELLYAYCAERGVPHRRCGKLVVATSPAEQVKLDDILRRGHANGVHALRPIDGAQARALEPALSADCVAALHSPDSGIVDSHALMNSLLGEAEAAGAMLALKSPFEEARRHGSGGWVVHTGGDEAFELGCRWLVNAAGLGTHRVAGAIEGLAVEAYPAQRLAKGHYFGLTGRVPFSRLIYPTPVDGGLGVHLTLDLGGQARFGPDVEWLPAGAAEAELDYAVDGSRKAAFERDIRRYWPGLQEGALVPAYTGVRPKLSGPGEPAADFLVQGRADHGLPGLVQMLGIESPGLTSCLALGEYVAGLVRAQPSS